MKKEGEYITAKVVSPDGTSMQFKIKETTPFSKMMDAYCKVKCISKNSVRFVFNGDRLPLDATPKSANLTNDDVVDAVLMQTGGAP